MLIGNILEKIDAQSAWELSADKLADNVRDSWLGHHKAGMTKFEEGFVEDASALPGLREEGFKGLVGLDYIFKWWGARDEEELAGEVDVIWKMIDDEGRIHCYRTWIKLAERDFVLGRYKEESAKREANRAEFRAAFAQWKKLFETV